MFQDPGFGFRISSFGFWFRVSGFGFRVPDFGFRVSGVMFRVLGFGCRVSGIGYRVSGFGFLFGTCGVLNLWGSWFRVSDFWVWGWIKFKIQTERFRAKKAQVQRLKGLSPTSPAQNPALSVLYVQYSLDRGTRRLTPRTRRYKSVNFGQIRQF